MHTKSRFRIGGPRIGARSLWTVVALSLAVACGDDGSSPTARPGTLAASLSSPNGAEGALLVEIDGPLRSADTDTGHLFHQRAEGRTQVLVVLEDPGQIRFRIVVDDVSRTPEYRIIEVSGPDDVLRPDLTGYSLEFAPS